MNLNKVMQDRKKQNRYIRELADYVDIMNDNLVLVSDGLEEIKTDLADNLPDINSNIELIKDDIIDIKEILTPQPPEA